MKTRAGSHGLALMLGMLVCGTFSHAETCTTQSQMQPVERDALANTARTLAEKLQKNDQAGLRAGTIADFQKDFSGIAGVMATTAPKLKGADAIVEQVYVLDASAAAKTGGGAAADTQFYCTLNKSQAETDFVIPQLPPGRYGFAMVRMEGTSPWRISMLLRQEGGAWQLAGLYPKALTAGGHDGLWYWKEARAMKSSHEPWNAWLYLTEAQTLLAPASFVSSTHLEKLQTEIASATPPAISGGIGGETPLAVKGADGTEYRFTSIAVDDSLGKEKADVAAHMKVAQMGNAAAARKRNVDAMGALIAAYPELRKAFHGVWIFAESAGQSPFATEQTMTEIH